MPPLQLSSPALRLLQVAQAACACAQAPGPVPLPELPWSCRPGHWGLCRSAVTEGNPWQAGSTQWSCRWRQLTPEMALSQLLILWSCLHHSGGTLWLAQHGLQTLAALAQAGHNQGTSWLPHESEASHTLLFTAPDFLQVVFTVQPSGRSTPAKERIQLILTGQT